MDILAASVWLRYLELLGEHFAFPSNGYKGAYVRDIAASLLDIHGEKFHRAAAEVMRDIPTDEPVGDKKKEHIDALISRAKSLLSDANYRTDNEHRLNVVLADIRQDLEE